MKFIAPPVIACLKKTESTIEGWCFCDVLVVNLLHNIILPIQDAAEFLHVGIA